MNNVYDNTIMKNKKEKELEREFFLAVSYVMMFEPLRPRWESVCSSKEDLWLWITENFTPNKDIPKERQDDDWCHKFTTEGTIVRPSCKHSLDLSFDRESCEERP